VAIETTHRFNPGPQHQHSLTKGDVLLVFPPTPPSPTQFRAIQKAQRSRAFASWYINISSFPYYVFQSLFTSSDELWSIVIREELVAARLNIIPDTTDGPAILKSKICCVLL
jgi:hypothetical protein